MKIYHLPEITKALVFDMDLTLYSNGEYGRFQIEKLAEIAGKKRGCLSAEDAKMEVEKARKEWASSHGGESISLSNIILSWGFTMEQNIKWREEAYNPEDFLSKDERLRETLSRLSAFFKLAVVTNNPVSIARRTLAVLGAADFFEVITGLDTCMVSKPHRLPFTAACESLKVPPENCVSIGDRYDIDLAVPLEMGMGGILVDGVEDVYTLPEILGKQNTGSGHGK